MSDKVYQTHTLKIEVPNPESNDIRPYIALFGTLQFFNKINLTNEERLRVINTLAVYHDKTPDCMYNDITPDRTGEK